MFVIPELLLLAVLALLLSSSVGSVQRLQRGGLQVMLPSSPLFFLHAAFEEHSRSSRAFPERQGRRLLPSFSVLNERSFVQVSLGFPVDERTLIVRSSREKISGKACRAFPAFQLSRQTCHERNERVSPEPRCSERLSSSWQTCSSLGTRSRRWQR